MTWLFRATHTHHVSGETGCEGGWGGDETGVRVHRKDGNRSDISSRLSDYRPLESTGNIRKFGISNPLHTFYGCSRQKRSTPSTIPVRRNRSYTTTDSIYTGRNGAVGRSGLKSAPPGDREEPAPWPANGRYGQQVERRDEPSREPNQDEDGRRLWSVVPFSWIRCGPRATTRSLSVLTSDFSQWAFRLPFT